MSIRNCFGILILSAFAACVTSVGDAAQPPATQPAATAGYMLPPRNILEVMQAPTPPVPDMSPTGDKLLLVTWTEYPSIRRVATPFLRLAGVRVEPKNHSKHDTPGGYGITPCASSLALVRIADGTQLPIRLPVGACPSRPVWSADGMRFAFENVAETSVELWVGDATTGAVRRVPGVRLNPMLEDEVQWMPDQVTLLVKLVPQPLGPPPPEPVTAAGPSVQQSDGERGQSSTYEVRDTLRNAHDEDLFDYYASSQLALIDAKAAAIWLVGKPGRYESLQPAPDGRHVLVATIHKPYSYVTTYDRFPHDVDVWNVAKPPNAAVQHIASLPLTERVPIRGVPEGPRDFSWRAGAAATLIWAEALDGGDWSVDVPARDKIMTWRAPFDSAPTEITRTGQRFGGLLFSEQNGPSLLTEYDINRHWRKTSLINVDDPRQPTRVLWDLSTDDRYANPGNPVMRQQSDGSWEVRRDGDAIYLSGGGSSPDGDRPFLDRLDLSTQKSARLFRSDKNSYEFFLAFLGPETGTMLTWRQSPSDPPNAVLRTLGEAIDAPAGEAVLASSSSPVTQIPDPVPQVRKIQKRLVKYKRDDGLDLSFTLYTPPDYQPGTRVPTILAAYPLDYAEAAKAGQVAGSQETFTRLRDYRLLLLAGYAIIDNASFPIIGDPKKAYDSYTEQLVADAKAAVDEAVRQGVADPERIGVTGHSHGALMTVNLLAHSNLFRAGVAGSGAYNKTLTPFGFQNERRSVWEATDVYLKVSPFFYADKLKTPLLIIHGADDANPGTIPLQSTALYEAIRGNGGTVRLVMLPHEPHLYTALESNEDYIFEMLRWFDQYVKNAPPRAESANN